MKESPAPSKIKAERIAADLTQAQCGALVYVGVRTWQKWESELDCKNHRAMPAAVWELFLIKIKSPHIRLKCTKELPLWLIEWLDDQLGSPATIIENALCKVHKLSPPKI